MTDLELLTALIVHEAGREPEDGQIAVGWVVRNRVMNPRSGWGSGWRGVMLAPGQFSGFSESGAAAELKQANAQIRQVASDVYGGRVGDPTGGATNYHAACASSIWSLPEYAGAKCPPSWTKKPWVMFLGQIGNHLFYRDGDLKNVWKAGASLAGILLVAGIVFWVLR